MGRTIVCGDIHGAHKALVQCLERSGFDNDNDTLIQIGDVIDGWSESYESVSELLKIKNLIAIRGNHDYHMLNFINKGVHITGWNGGGYSTLMSYIKYAERDVTVNTRMSGIYTDFNNTDIPKSHIDFFKSQIPYVVIGGKCFVHGGFDRERPIISNFETDLMWNRDLWYQALSYEVTVRKELKGNIIFRNFDEFEEIFIGHTPTINWTQHSILKNKKKKPIKFPIRAANVWNVDTGAGWDGKLSFMDIDSKEYWRSDNVNKLYKGESGRNYKGIRIKKRRKK